MVGERRRLRIDAAVTALIERALAEDRVAHDVTTDALIPPGMPGAATLVAKSPGVLAGGEVARAVFHRADASLRAELLMEDGDALRPGDAIARVEGPVGGILRAERCALNFLQHMSGIATETARYAAAVAGTRAAIVDTRKTAPGLRALQKHAVLVGGGRNHRMDLADGVLIKDNHIAALRAQEVGLAESCGGPGRGAPHAEGGDRGGEHGGGPAGAGGPRGHHPAGQHAAGGDAAGGGDDRRQGAGGGVGRHHASERCARWRRRAWTSYRWAR